MTALAIRRTALQVPLIAAMLLCTMTAARPALAHEAGHETTTPVMKQDIPEAKGRHVFMITVAYEPGQASEPHRHPGSIFAYVLDGEVESQLDGQPARVYKAGEAWYEPPGAKHLVSRNASSTKPAKLLVYGIAEGNTPVKLPLDAR
ncbi:MULTISPECIES: cupin domain-containing protein [Cupriavidus]|uniref:cupin domain-containing protein n=1 Tax=Cupriavidus TaxID=106589 RepID=UPI0002A2085E|nr:MULTISPECIES: cupin domain-containing protein [Cupriavidus]EKZ95483.1 cupin [Cupriavidus sp. HMR-1]QWC92206.1 cupin domain-containing protein [Cupriavidus metallidurans]